MPAKVVLEILIELSKRAWELYKKMEENPVDYKNLTPDQIKELLLKDLGPSEMDRAADAKAGIEEG